MRSNIVSEAGLSTRLKQWWEGIPFLTSVVVAVCGVVYLVSLLVGYDSFAEVCFWPSAIISRFQVYRIFTSIFFHGSMLHLVFNMLALVPLGSELERAMGSVRLFYIITLLATSNAIFHLLIASIAAYNPIYPYRYFMDECAIGFSGVLFSMIVIETSLSRVQSRSMFGLFNVPAKLYPWILLVVFQLLMTNISLLGHLCGILSGFAYTYGLFKILIPGNSFYSRIESYNWLSTCVRRPNFITCSGGNFSGYIPTHSSHSTSSSSSLAGNVLTNLSSWIPQKEAHPLPPQENSRFPGRGRTLGSAQSNNTVLPLSPNIIGATPVRQEAVASDGEIQKLIAMGFDEVQAEVAFAAANGDVNVAIEILMNQQHQVGKSRLLYVTTREDRVVLHEDLDLRFRRIPQWSRAFKNSLKV